MTGFGSFFVDPYAKVLGPLGQMEAEVPCPHTPDSVFMQGRVHAKVPGDSLGNICMDAAIHTYVHV